MKNNDKYYIRYKPQHIIQIYQKIYPSIKIICNIPDTTHEKIGVKHTPIPK